MGGSEAESSITICLFDINKFPGLSGTGEIIMRKVGGSDSAHADSLNPRNSFQNQILGCDGSRLVEAADIHTSSKRNSERFRAEDGFKRMRFASLADM